MGLFTRRSKATITASSGIPSPVGVTGVSSPFADQSHLASITWAELFGQYTDSRPITRAEAMTVPTVARVRTVFASSIGRLPIIVMNGNDAVPGRTCLTQPEPGRPRFITLLWTVDQMFHHGRAWWVVRDRYAETGKPRTFEWIAEWRGRFDEAGNLIGTNDTNETFKTDDVKRIDGPHEGILKTAARAIRFALDLDRAALRAARNPVPSIELHQTSTDSITPEERTALVDGWAKARNGENGGVGYTNASIELKTHGQQPEQLLIEGRKYAALELVRALGASAWIADVGIEGSSITYANVASRSRGLVDFELMPYMTAIAERLSMDDILPHGQWCKFDTDALLLADFNDRMTGYKTAIEAGIYTKEELRARENGKPLEESE